MLILSSILIAVVTVVQYNLQSQEYHNQRLERKENQLILSINYVIENSIYSDNIFSNINDEKINEISNIQNIEFKIFDLKGDLIKTSNIKSDFNYCTKRMQYFNIFAITEYIVNCLLLNTNLICLHDIICLHDRNIRYSW